LYALDAGFEARARCFALFARFVDGFDDQPVSAHRDAAACAVLELWTLPADSRRTAIAGKYELLPL
jgi:hypothetical protein